LVAEHGFPRGQAADGQRGGVGEGQLIGDRGDDPVVHGQPLRPAAVAGHIAGAHHPVTDRKSRGRRTGSGHDTGELPAQDDPTARRGAADRPDERLTGIDAYRADLDHQVPVAKLRLVDLDQVQGERVQSMRLLVGQRLHGATSPRLVQPRRCRVRRALRPRVSEAVSGSKSVMVLLQEVERFS